MKIANYNNSEHSQNPHGIQSVKMYDKDHGLIMHLLLKPGEKLKPHKTPVDVAFYVLEGSPSILIGDEKRKVEKDDIIESPKNIVHCIYNESDNDARILVMKLPKPGAPAQFV